MGIPACLAGQSRGVWSGPMGVSNFLGGLQIFGGVSKFSGGSPIFWGAGLRGVRGTPQFFGGEHFFLISAFFGDTPPPESSIWSKG